MTRIMRPDRRSIPREAPCPWGVSISIGLLVVLLTVGLGVILHHHSGTSGHETCTLCQVHSTPTLVGAYATFVVALAPLRPTDACPLEGAPLDPFAVHISSRAPPV